MSLQRLRILWKEARAGVAKGLVMLYDFSSPYRAVYMIDFVSTSHGMSATSIRSLIL
jgi:hypothetical protein